MSERMRLERRTDRREERRRNEPGKMEFDDLRKLNQ